MSAWVFVIIYSTILYKVIEKTNILDISGKPREERVRYSNGVYYMVVVFVVVLEYRYEVRTYGREFILQLPILIYILGTIVDRMRYSV